MEAACRCCGVFVDRSDSHPVNPAALAHLQDLVTEPVQSWDAVICSSNAGKSVVETVLNSREEALADRSGGDVACLRASRPQLPVIPLPLPDSAMVVPEFDKRQARKALGLPEEASVVLWLGRLSVYTKLDPWPTYAILDRSEAAQPSTCSLGVWAR